MIGRRSTRRCPDSGTKGPKRPRPHSPLETLEFSRFGSGVKEIGQFHRRKPAIPEIGLGILAVGLSAAVAQFPTFPGLGLGEETGDESVPVEAPADLYEPVVTPREGIADRFARIFSAELRDIEERQAEILEELDKLPRFAQGATSQNFFGYHDGQDRRRPKWVQIDLGETVQPDAIALVPVTVQIGNEPVAGYGFPRRFRIDISDDPAFGSFSYQTIVDYRHQDLFGPKERPFFHDLSGVSGRYLRVTAITHWRPADDPESSAREVFALGEFLVLRGDRNIAAGRPVTSLDTSERTNLWSRQYLTDGRTILGIPQEIRESPTKGFRSQTQEKVAEMWVQIDLGEAKEIQEIRLIPADPPELVPAPALQFPNIFRVEIGESPDMANPALLANFSSGQPPKSANDLVIIPVEKGNGRYLRLTAERRTPGAMSFALAEMEVYAKDRNIALGKTVTAAESDEEQGWSTKYLVDGYSSRHKLATYRNWLSELSFRADLIGEWREKEQRRIALVEETLGKILRWSGLGSGGILLFVLVGLARSRSRRLDEMESLRRQIASDLHDDIGSNLSSIALLAELGNAEAEEPDLAREEFSSIKGTADKTIESMRDIVWLIRPGEQTWKQMIARFRETAAKLLKTHEYKVDILGTMHGERLPLDFKRDLFLIYKEILNNIVKHAEAGKVQIFIETRRGRLRLKIEDDGKGFDPNTEDFRKGYGLLSLERRAHALGARIEIASEVGKGTRIELNGRIP